MQRGPFQAYGQPIGMVISLKYLGQVLIAGEDNWPSVIGNLKKARKSWAWLTRILGRKGSNPRVFGKCFIAVFQSVLIFGSETWVMTPHMGRALGSFQHRVARRITERQLRQWEEGGW